MKCFYCKQEIHDEAKKCQFCHEFLPPKKNPIEILKENFCSLGILGYFLWLFITIFFSIFAMFITGWGFWVIFGFMLGLVIIAISYKMRYETMLTFLSLCLTAIAIKMRCK